MTADQVGGLFDAGESFIEGTIGAALVALWLIVVALYLARPYMVGNLHKFTLRLGADLWWIVYVAIRDLLLINVFLGSFIFFYPDVVSGKDLPITGGLAAVCAFAVLLIKLVKGDGDLRWFRVQVLLLGLGATLYIVPYMTFTVGGFPPHFGIDTIIAAVVGGIVLSIVSTVIGFVPILNPSR